MNDNPKLFTRVGETFPRDVAEMYESEKRMHLVCPHCQNDNPNMITTYGHRRESMECQCEVCAKGWVEIFKEVKKEEIIPASMRKIV